jgi:hypothetical protein
MFSRNSPIIKPISSRLRALGVIVCCASYLCLGEPVGSQAEDIVNAEPAKSEQIAGWIAKLDDNRYAIRENAQLRLEEAGGVAIDQVAKSARAGSLESSTRALNILLAWSDGKDPALRIAALEKIVDLSHRPTEAQQAGRILADAREQFALAKIVELGGNHNINSIQQGARIARIDGRFVLPMQVIIGMQWKGELDGLKYLKQIPRAKILSLYSAPLGDEVIPVLLDLPQVTRIELYGSKLSEEAIKQLRERLSPRVTLEVRSGALLGIVGSLEGPAQVREVKEGTAAHKAGLRLGDVIVEIDGVRVADFPKLTEHIATHEPGDTVSLKVIRSNRQKKNQEHLSIKVTFDQWGNQPAATSQPAIQPIPIVVPGGNSIDRR